MCWVATWRGGVDNCCSNFVVPWVVVLFLVFQCPVCLHVQGTHLWPCGLSALVPLMLVSTEIAQEGTDARQGSTQKEDEVKEMGK